MGALDYLFSMGYSFVIAAFVTVFLAAKLAGED